MDGLVCAGDADRAIAHDLSRRSAASGPIPPLSPVFEPPMVRTGAMLPAAPAANLLIVAAPHHSSPLRRESERINR